MTGFSLNFKIKNRVSRLICGLNMNGELLAPILALNCFLTEWQIMFYFNIITQPCKLICLSLNRKCKYLIFETLLTVKTYLLRDLDDITAFKVKNRTK